MDNKRTPAEALVELAKGMEKLAEAIEAQQGKERRFQAPLPDYGKLGSASPSGADPLTGFLLR